MKTINNIIFYNHFHKGDIFLSRSFVDDICKKLNNRCHYLHQNGVGFFRDINIEEVNEVDYLRKIDNWSCHFIQNNSLFLNTWYNSCYGKYMKGCTIHTLYEVFKTYYSTLGLKIDSFESYIPNIDYTKFDITVDESVFTDNMVLFCNNIPLSGQSNVKNLDNILHALSVTYPKIKFLVTNSSSIFNDNIIHTENICPRNNLFDISYIGTKCKHIIGRSSGPYSFSITKNNINNKNLKYTSICSSEDLVDFGLKSITDKDKFNYINSNLSDEDILLNLIQILNNE
jgi:hypothetical protein